ncbi:MAG: glycosyltransferase family 2 protein [Acidobacteriota bacterium]|jgi:glycosyltransferase involved in cell wall biosynthesis
MSAQRPRITIVMPTLNQAKYIEEAVQSILEQNYENLECLVFDGGSTDGTLDILKRYEDRLQWWSEKDRGQADAINKGLKRATGDILGYLNSDDLLEPGALDKVAGYFLEHPEVDLVYGEGYLMKADGTGKHRFPATEPVFDLWRLIHLWDFILQQSTFWRRRLLERIGYFNESLHYGLDWDYWIRAAKAGKVGYIPEYLGCLREYDAAKSFAGGSRRIKELYGITRTHTGKRWPPPGIIIYASDWLEASLYRKLNSAFGGRLTRTAEPSRKFFRGLLARYIQKSLRSSSAQ